MKSKEELKSFFENGDIPKQDDFWEWQDSYWHKNEKLPLENIDYDFSNKADLIDGKIPATQLPSYVDDILEFDSLEDLPNPGERGKIYVINSTNTQLRWSGSEYVPIISGHNVMITDSPQDVFPNGTKTFWTDDHNNSLHIKNTNSEGAGITFDSNGTGQIVYNDDQFRFTNSSGTDSIPIISDGFIKSDSSNDYVLTGGGGHKAISDFVLDTDLSNYVTINTPQTIESRKTFNGAIDNSYSGASIMVNGNGSAIYPTVSFHQPGQYAATLSFRSNGFNFMDYSGTLLTDVNAAKFIKGGSDDSYLLLGGGGHVPRTSFASGNYRDYQDNREINPNEISPMQISYGFTTWNNDITTSTYADFLHFGGYTDASGGQQNLIAFNKNGFGIRQFQGPWQDTTPYSKYVDYWHTGNFNPNNYVDKTSSQDITGIKAFYTYLGGDVGNNRLWIRSSDGSNPAISFIKDGVDNSQLAFDGFGLHFKNTNSTGYFPIKANGFIKNGYDDDFVLLAGGSAKSISDFAAVSQLGNYVTINTPQTIIADKSFSQTAKLTIYGNEFNLNNTQSYNTTSGNGNISAGWVHTFYDSRWKYGIVRGGDGTSNNVKFGFDFSSDGGITYNRILSIDANEGYLDFPSSIFTDVIKLGGEDYLQRNLLRRGWSPTYNFYTELNVPSDVNNTASFILSQNGNGYIGGNQIWHSGNLEDYHQYGLGRTAEGSTYYDINSVGNTSILGINDNTVNRPLGYGSVWTHRKNTSEFTQIAVDLFSGDLLTRGWSAGTGDTGWRNFWHNGNFNPASKANAMENATGVGFSGGLSSNDPYFYHATDGYIPLAKVSSLASKVNAWENGTAIGFSGGNYPTNDGTAYPYIYHNNAGSNYPYIPLATQAYVSTNYIPKTHPVYNITQAYIDGWQTYLGYWDNRQISPSSTSPHNLQFGFASYFNNNTAPYADYLHFGGYSDSSGGNQNLIMFHKNGFGIRQYQGSSQSVSPYSQYVDYWHSGNFNPDNKVNKSGDTMTGNLNALTISAQNASDKLIYDNIENYGSPLKINANASLGIYLQANGTNVATINAGGLAVTGALSLNGQDVATQSWVSTNYTPISHVGSGGTAHANATTSTAGFMSSADKTKLDNINTSNFVTINTTQTVTGSKNFADGSQVQLLGGDGNHIIPQRIPGGSGTIVSGHDYTHYDTRWRVGNVRGGSTDSTALGFFFSSDNGSSFSNRVSIDSANGQINTAIHGNSAEWNDIAQNGVRSGNNGFTTLQNYREIDDNTFDIDDVTVEKFNIVFNASANGRVVIHSLPNGQTYHLHNFSASNILRVDVEGYSNVDNIEPGETKVYMAHNSGHLRRISSSNTYSII